MHGNQHSSNPDDQEEYPFRTDKAFFKVDNVRIWKDLGEDMLQDCLMGISTSVFAL